VTEYIEREKALDFISEVEPIICMPPNNKPTFTAVKDPDMVAYLESIPAADVRPVVTCADCKHNNACLTQAFVEDCGKIPLDRNTFFCADGERTKNA